MYLGNFKGPVQVDKDTSLANRNVPCPIDKITKEVIFDTMLWVRPLIQILLGSQKG